MANFIKAQLQAMAKLAPELAQPEKENLQQAPPPPHLPTPVDRTMQEDPTQPAQEDQLQQMGRKPLGRAAATQVDSPSQPERARSRTPERDTAQDLRLKAPSSRDGVPCTGCTRWHVCFLTVWPPQGTKPASGISSWQPMGIDARGMQRSQQRWDADHPAETAICLSDPYTHRSQSCCTCKHCARESAASPTFRDELHKKKKGTSSFVACKPQILLNRFLCRKLGLVDMLLHTCT